MGQERKEGKRFPPPPPSPNLTYKAWREEGDGGGTGERQFAGKNRCCHIRKCHSIYLADLNIEKEMCTLDRRRAGKEYGKIDFLKFIFFVSRD